MTAEYSDALFGPVPDVPLNATELAQLYSRRRGIALRITDIFIPELCDVDDVYVVERRVSQMYVASGLDPDPETVRSNDIRRQPAKPHHVMGRRVRQ